MTQKTGTDSIPARLRSLGYASYRDYLNSDHWRSVRRRFLGSRLVRRDGLGHPACTFCGASDLQLHLHHRSYGSLGNEKLNHLVLLCEVHHGEAHERARSGENLWSATKGVRRRIRKREHRHPVDASSAGQSTGPIKFRLGGDVWTARYEMNRISTAWVLTVRTDDPQVRSVGYLAARRRAVELLPRPVGRVRSASALAARSGSV